MTPCEEHIARLLRAPQTAPSRFACEDEIVICGPAAPRLAWPRRVAASARQALASHHAARRSTSAAAW